MPPGVVHQPVVSLDAKVNRQGVVGTSHDNRDCLVASANLCNVVLWCFAVICMNTAWSRQRTWDKQPCLKATERCGWVSSIVRRLFEEQSCSHGIFP